MYQKIGYDRQPVQVVLRRSKQVGYGALTAPSWAGGKGGEGESFSAVTVHLPVDGRRVEHSRGSSSRRRKEEEEDCMYSLAVRLPSSSCYTPLDYQTVVFQVSISAYSISAHYSFSRLAAQADRRQRSIGVSSVCVAVQRNR